MALIDPETLAWLREVFNTCGPFESNRELAAVFVDARIAPWRDDLPEADSRIDRVDALIAYLHNNFSTATSETGDIPPQNALVLFAQVLVDRTAPEDSCFVTLQAVAQRLAEEIAQAAITPEQIIVGRVPTVSAITDAALLDLLISNQKSAIRSYRSFALGLVILGLTITVAGFAVPGVWLEAAMKPWVGMGGLFIASLSLLQFKEVLIRQEKAGLFATMKNRLSVLQHDPEYALVRERVDKLVWQVIEHGAVN